MSSIPLLLFGASGRMGLEVRRLLAGDSSVALVACVARSAARGKTPEECWWLEAARFSARDLEKFPTNGVVLDLSLPDGTEALVSALERAPRAAVIATTGLPAALEKRIAALAKSSPILRAKNLSLGVAVARGWLAGLPAAARTAYVADVLEQHHAGKKDAPSGTAIDLAAALGGMGTGGDPRRAREAVAVHSVRAGTVPGTHRVVLSGDGETLELVHTVYDRSVFARGALRAVHFVHGRKPGLYSADDLVRETPTT